MNALPIKLLGKASKAKTSMKSTDAIYFNAFSILDIDSNLSN